MENKDKPAYPELYVNDPTLALSCHKGITKREYFAGLAFQAILQNRELQLAYFKDIAIDKNRFPNITNLNCLAVHATNEADELLKQLENGNK